MTEKRGGVLSDTDRTELLNRVEEKAGSYMNKYGGCGQCTLRALQEEMDLGGGAAVLKAAGFTNMGIALTQNICGALLGCIMAMGLACGREDFADTIYPQPEVVDETYQLPRSLMLIRGFYQRFIQEFGSWSCRDLQIRIFGRSFETVILEEEERFHLAGGHTACVSLVGRAARLAAETILELPCR
ncbi:MAG: C-GCAxxG-C-C family protein [Acidobacteriia bacterium]|nr:C-GCAxxG-C-C family protein [Terriglobia bacterium]